MGFAGLAVVQACQLDWWGMTLACYGLGASGLLQVLALLCSEWSTRFKAAARFTGARHLDEADWVLVVPERLAGSMELAPLERRVLVSAEEADWLPSIT
jgi:hypothetical protein